MPRRRCERARVGRRHGDDRDDRDTEATDPAAVVGRAITTEAERYRGGADRPLGAFVGMIGTYLAAVGVGGIAVRRRGRLRERPAAADLALVALATHKASRLVTKDPVTSPLRAPFTRFDGTEGPAQLHEALAGVDYLHLAHSGLTAKVTER